LKSWYVLSRSVNYLPAFIEPECSLSRSQEDATGPWPESIKSSPDPYNLFKSTVHL